MKEFNSNKAGICANCGANIEYNFNNIVIEEDLKELTFLFVCANCGGAGSEIYTLEFNGNNIIID